MLGKALELLGLFAALFLIVLGVLHLPDLFSSDGIAAPLQNADIVDVLSIVLAVIGVAGYGVYLWISKEINELMEKSHTEEKAYITSMVSIVLGQTNEKLYRLLCNSATLSTDDKDQSAKKQIDEAIGMVQVAVREFAKVEHKGHHFEDLVNRNNHAYYLALRWEYYKEKKTDPDFLKHLEQTEKLRDYLSDRKIALDNIQYIDDAKPVDDPQRWKRFLGHYADTKQRVDRVFSAQS